MNGLPESFRCYLDIQKRASSQSLGMWEPARSWRVLLGNGVVALASLTDWGSCSELTVSWLLPYVKWITQLSAEISLPGASSPSTTGY